MNKTAVSILLIMLSISIFSEELTLEKAVELAFRNNLTLTKHELDVQNSKTQMKQAFKVGLPKMTFGGTYIRLDEEPVNPMESLGSALEKMGIPQDDTSAVMTKDMYQYNVRVIQPIYNGVIFSGIKMARLFEDLAALNLANAKDSLKLNVKNDYMNVIKAKKSLDVLQKSKLELTENYEKLKEMFELNIVTKTSLLEIKYRMTEVDTFIIGASNGIELTKLKLARALGVKNLDSYTFSEVDTKVMDIDKINIDQDIKNTIKKSKMMKLLELNKKLKKEEEGLKRSGMYPVVNFIFDYDLGGTQFSESLKTDNATWKAMINMSMDIFDWGFKLDELKKAKNESKKVALDIKNTEDNIEISIRAAYLELIRISKFLEARKEALENSRENYDLQKEKFTLNLSTSTDILAAENKLNKSQIEVITTEIDLFLAYENYKYLTSNVDEIKIKEVKEVKEEIKEEKNKKEAKDESKK